MGTSSLCVSIHNRLIDCVKCCQPDISKEEINEIGPPSTRVIRTNENKIETEAEVDRSKFNNGIQFKRNAQNFPQQKYQSQNLSSLENESESLYRINRIKSIIDKAQLLILEVILSPSLKSGNKIKISPLGIEKSLRKKNDGIVYFGYFSLKEQQEKLLDYIITPTPNPLSHDILINNNNNPQTIGKFFQIEFNPDYMKYYIKDSRNGFGTFVKIQSETLIKDNTLINIGNSFISITLGFDDDTIMPEYPVDSNKKIPSLPNRDYSNNLNIKIVSKNLTYDPMNFQPTRSAIKIGRTSNCEVFVDDTLLSRIHCTIEYRPNVGWVIRDGNVQKNKDGSIDVKPSMNGSWFYAVEDMAIYEGMVFKSNNSVFQCNYQ